MSANELSLTFLLKADGSQATAEFQRLTAQISSQLAGLNRPNDGAAAAAITAQRQRATTAVAISKETAASIVKEEKQLAATMIRESRAVENVRVQSERTVAATHKQNARAIEQEEKRLAATMIRESRAAQRVRVQGERELASEFRRLERERQQIASQNARAIERLAKQEADARIREGRRAANGLLASLRDLQREEQRLRATITQRASGGTNAFLAGAAGGITALVGVSAVSEIRQAGQAWLDYSNKLQTTKIAFTTMLGSAQLAEAHLKELQQFALKTPFQFGELIDASQRMQALGFNAQQVIPVLTDVGNAVAGAGGGSERLDRVVLALSQIQSKGKVATQELNQLEESGIPAFRILQDTLGKSGAEVRKLVEEGQISSKVFLDAFQKFSQQNFGGLMEQQSRTFSGAMSNIKDALLQTSATAFEPLFDKLSKTAVGFSQAATSSKDFQDKLKTVGSVSATILDGVIAVTLAVRDAVRLVTAAISGQLGVIVEGWRAVAHATAAAFFEALALGRAIRGDLVGAEKAHRVAQDEMRLATAGAGKAFEAQGKVVREVIAIYKEAEERAKRLKDAQAKVGGELVIGAGILRKKVPDTNDDLTKKDKGADPAATAKRLAELRLANTIAGLDAEEDALKRSLARQETEFARYVAEIEVLESHRHQQVIAGLIEEAKAAEQLRKGHQREIAEQEIANKRQQEEIRHKEASNKLTDEIEAHKRKEFEATTSVLRATIDAQLRIAAIGDEQRVSGLKALAEARVKTEEQAEREILRIRLAAIDREKERLETELKATVSIRDPEEQLKARAQLNLELRVLTEERIGIEQGGERDIEAGRRRDLASERRYADELKQIKQQILDVEREAAEERLRLLRIHFGSRRDIIRTQLQIDIASENQRHSQALETIRNLEQENRESNRIQAEKDAEAAALNLLREAEEERHRLAMQGIRAQGQRDEQEADPFGRLKLGTDQLKQFASELESSIIPLNRLLSDSFFQVADAIGNVVANWVLLGETGPAVMRKILAQALANLAKEATVNAIKELALGFAMLFINPAASAGHFTSAALWGSIAGGAAVAGRAVAGDLFNQKTASAGAPSQGSSNPEALPTIVTGRNQQQTVRHDHHLHVTVDENKFGQALDVHIESGFRDGGKLRDLVFNDGGV